MNVVAPSPHSETTCVDVWQIIGVMCCCYRFSHKYDTENVHGHIERPTLVVVRTLYKR